VKAVGARRCGCVRLLLAFFLPLVRLVAGEWFDPAVLHEVVVRLPEAEWAVLRKEAPDVLAQLGPQRTNGLAAKAYRRHAGEITLDGTVWKASIRKRGFIGSVSRERPSLNIEFPDLPDGRGPGGWRRVTLANTQQDASGMHLSLANAIFRESGIPASRTALARVTVNGEALGVYTMVEPVDRDFLQQHFGSGEGPLWEGALTDLRPGWLAMFDAKRGTRDSDLESLREVAVALSDREGVDWKAIGKRVDLEQFLRFWVAEVLADHWDGYANNQNNYFIHRRASDGRLVFIPWGADQCLGSPNPFTPRRAPVSVRATGLLARRLYDDPEWRERYREQLRITLDTLWNEERWLAEMDRLDGLISTNGWPGITGRKAVVQKTREFFRKRRSVLRKDLEGPAPSWTAPERTNTLVRKWGHVTADFETTFQMRLPVDWFTNGSVQLDLQLDGKPRPFTRAGISVSRGFDIRDTNKVALNVLGMHGIAAFLVPSVQVWKEEFVPGRTVKVDFFANQGFFFEGMPAANGGGAGLMSGTLRLDEAGIDEGSPIKGRLEADIWQFPK
jgi:hypothetical protein